MAVNVCGHEVARMNAIIRESNFMDPRLSIEMTKQARGSSDPGLRARLTDVTYSLALGLLSHALQG